MTVQDDFYLRQGEIFLHSIVTSILSKISNFKFILSFIFEKEKVQSHVFSDGSVRVRCSIYSSHFVPIKHSCGVGDIAKTT